jgi:type II secretion system protein G
MYKWLKQKNSGFTIVELLIVIVVLGILASITVAAYGGIAQRARDGQRYSDVKTIAKALELYYTDNGSYPAPPDDMPCANEHDTARSGCPNWTWLIGKLSAYVAKLPIDPKNTLGSWNSPSQHTYYYVALPNNSSFPASCASSSQTYQEYYLSYWTENEPIKNELNGSCSNPSPFYPSASSVYRSNYVVIH